MHVSPNYSYQTCCCCCLSQRLVRLYACMFRPPTAIFLFVCFFVSFFFFFKPEVGQIIHMHVSPTYSYQSWLLLLLFFKPEVGQNIDMHVSLTDSYQMLFTTEGRSEYRHARFTYRQLSKVIYYRR